MSRGELTDCTQHPVTQCRSCLAARAAHCRAQSTSSVQSLPRTRLKAHQNINKQTKQTKLRICTDRRPIGRRRIRFMNLETKYQLYKSNDWYASFRSSRSFQIIITPIIPENQRPNENPARFTPPNANTYSKYEDEKENRPR